MNTDPKIIALYLPQFHVIPENDKWWGEGFTEWTNVKKAVPLFSGHNQPRVPLNDNYYDLSDVTVMRWQADLAKQHGIYGFCYYHYWFNGKKLLHIPLENMLADKLVDIPFCFSWANEPWARTWDGRDTDVLMPQVYGGRKEWLEHFSYLLNFFKDDRYIKVDGKPMMVIYRVSNIPNVNDMIDYWNTLAIENGFVGIHIVETLNSREKEPFAKNSAAAFEFEPTYTLHHKYSFKYRLRGLFNRKIYKLALKSYDSIYKCIVNRRQIATNHKRYLGAFMGWDNSPRKGKRALIVTGSSPEKFGKYLKLQFENAVKYDNDYIFLNAWNEWAEGTYLEPDLKHGFSYLEQIKSISKS
ncbi:glycoside hydrolase family 99-like domain-containing protein [Pontibacter sp. SGAir0037]|uniref:glycosyltransferase WbsX family protein n=1 Tax=Pontibacter sp. SGAir0037 TaxID=2571030 RepID=UPI0010CCBA65|nr:glycoside hydrolase family 99-like domain-containing protein [Pontibacter sp. SGAir0037]QCR20981.1 glycosyl transferase [Pontibacter sp. SGAir0037]